VIDVRRLHRAYLTERQTVDRLVAEVAGASHAPMAPHPSIRGSPRSRAWTVRTSRHPSSSHRYHAGLALSTASSRMPSVASRCCAAASA
jgi:hypothetical protein